MKKFMNNLNGTWLSVSTFLYGISLIFNKTTIVILEPPLRNLLILCCLISSLINLYAIYKKHPHANGIIAISQCLIWAVIAFLYMINPIPNSGWIMAISVIGFSFIMLYRDDYRKAGDAHDV